MKSIRGIIKDELLRAAREDLTFTPVEGDDVGPILPESIEYSRNKAGGKNQEFDPDTSIAVPGLILSAPKIYLPPSEGHCNQDDWHYHWLWQIVDAETGHPDANQETYWRWQEQLAAYFNFNKINDVVNETRGCVVTCTAQMVNDLDEKTWSRSRMFIAGVIVDTIIRQNRGIV